jgi:hypothetical protein
MNKIYIPILAAAICLITLASCQKELITPITGDNTAVVESYLKAGDSTLTVYISKIIPYSDDTVDAKIMIPGIDVYINGDKLTETDTGTYVLNLANQKVKGGTTYNLQFDYGGKTVTSQTIIPQAPADFASTSSTIYVERVSSGTSGPPSMMDPVTLSWSNTDASYYYLMVNYLEETPDYINSNINHSGFEFVQGATPTQESTYSLDQRVINCFGTYQLVLFKVNSEFNDVFTKNGTNSNNLVNPITNITNGFGVFTGMNSDTLYLEVKPY